MMQVTQKELRNMAGKPYCEDITHGREEDYQRIMKEEGWLDTMAEERMVDYEDLQFSLSSDKF